MRIVPPIIPDPRDVVLISGVFELLGAFRPDAEVEFAPGGGLGPDAVDAGRHARALLHAACARAVPVHPGVAAVGTPGRAGDPAVADLVGQPLEAGAADSTEAERARTPGPAEQESRAGNGATRTRVRHPLDAHVRNERSAPAERPIPHTDLAERGTLSDRRRLFMTPTPLQEAPGMKAISPKKAADLGKESAARRSRRRRIWAQRRPRISRGRSTRSWRMSSRST